jgi:hypothetical protein
VGNRKNEYVESDEMHVPGAPRLLDAQYDNLFKTLVTAEWCVKSDGNVEAPTGYFSITEIPAHEGEFREMYAAIEDSLEPEFTVDEAWPAAGWYVTIENSDGVIFVYEVINEAEAKYIFAELEKQYLDWTDAGNLP